MLMELDGSSILNANISAGGVGPTPLFLKKSSEYLAGKKVSLDVIEELLRIAQTEIAPISDARGTEEYKRLLLNQLIKGHFAVWYPEMINAEFLTM